MTLIDRVRASVAQDPAASLCVRCILVRDGRRALVATMVRMVQLAQARGSVLPSPNETEKPRTRPVFPETAPPATLQVSTHVTRGR